MEKSEKQIKKEHFQNLVAVALADGVLDDNELYVLTERAEEYGIEKAFINEVIKNAENLEFLIPLNDEDREEQLADAVHMAMVDGQVDDKEFQLCLKIAEKLDLDEDYLNYIIKLTKKMRT